MNSTKNVNKNWSKQCGQFTFKNPTKKDDFGCIIVSVYYNDEFIGVISCVKLNNVEYKNSYYISIYDFDINITTSTSVGIIKCLGLVNGLPEKILKVEFNTRKSDLVKKRKVLIEKHQPLEKLFIYLFD